MTVIMVMIVMVLMHTTATTLSHTGSFAVKPCPQAPAAASTAPSATESATRRTAMNVFTTARWAYLRTLHTVANTPCMAATATLEKSLFRHHNCSSCYC